MMMMIMMMMMMMMNDDDDDDDEHIKCHVYKVKHSSQLYAFCTSIFPLSYSKQIADSQGAKYSGHETAYHMMISGRYLAKSSSIKVTNSFLHLSVTCSSPLGFLPTKRSFRCGVYFIVFPSNV